MQKPDAIELLTYTFDYIHTDTSDSETSMCLITGNGIHISFQ